MMSRNSCSKGLVRDCMKRNLWAIVLSTVGFFMAQLLPVIMTAQHSLSAHKQDLVNLSAVSYTHLLRTDYRTCRARAKRHCRAVLQK